MIKLRVGYFISGIITGLILLLSFFATIPDGKLHIVVCDVGQGDGMYIRFPDGRDMVVDGGPNASIIGCLSRHMPFWDRTIDVAVLTHPQKDHMNGLLEILNRYHIEYLVRSDAANSTEGFDQLVQMIKRKHISEKLVTAGETVAVGSTKLSIAWPSREQIAKMNDSKRPGPTVQGPTLHVLGASTQESEVNDASVVFSLSYGAFDALFMGDGDSRIQSKLISTPISQLIPDGTLEFLKVPHHGSKTGLTESFLCFVARCHLARQGDTLEKPLAVISVGKNSYGHPAGEILSLLKTNGFNVVRTDQSGDIEVVSDGNGWSYAVSKR